MLSRAVIVLLVVLNVGVALWWALRPDSAPPSASHAGDADGGAVARLQLLREVAAGRGPPLAAGSASGQPAPTAVPSAPPAVTAPPALERTPVPGASAAVDVPSLRRCYAVGPFTTPETLTAARTALQPQVDALRVRVEIIAARGWRVVVPPLPERAAAQALAERIKAAGFDDYFVVPTGAEANSVALGRYGSERSARQREASLRGAGFDARAEPIGATGSRSWLDVAVQGRDFDAALARSRTGAAQARAVDCTATP